MIQDAVEYNACGMPMYDTRNLIIREDIMRKAKELATLIGTSVEVQDYQQAEQKIQNHQPIQQLIQKIKKKQKEVVAFESFGNDRMVNKIETEMSELQDQLDEYPIVLQFKQSQQDINYLLQSVMSVISDIVSQKVNVHTGSETPPSSCDG